jgi:hypothetical protein
MSAHLRIMPMPPGDEPPPPSLFDRVNDAAARIDRIYDEFDRHDIILVKLRVAELQRERAEEKVRRLTSHLEEAHRRGDH